MTNPQRCLSAARRGALAWCSLGLLVSCAATWNPGPRPSGEGDLLVSITGFEHRDGQLLVSVFLGPEGFPNDPDLAYANRKLAIDADPVQLAFPGVPAGPVAVSVFHDEDGDLELDRNLLGIPTEPWGVSRGATGSFGPPAYADAQLELAAGGRLDIDITIQ